MHLWKKRHIHANEVCICVCGRTCLPWRVWRTETICRSSLLFPREVQGLISDLPAWLSFSALNHVWQAFVIHISRNVILPIYKQKFLFLSSLKKNLHAIRNEGDSSATELNQLVHPSFTHSYSPRFLYHLRSCLDAIERGAVVGKMD